MPNMYNPSDPGISRKPVELKPGDPYTFLTSSPFFVQIDMLPSPGFEFQTERGTFRVTRSTDLAVETVFVK